MTAVAAKAVLAAAARALGSETSDAARVPRGWGGQNWRVTADGGERFLVKFGDPASAEKWSAASSAYDLARRAGVPAPRLAAFEAHCPEAGGAAMRLLTWVDGVEPASVLRGDAAVGRFFGDLGTALRRLHAIDLETFSSRLDGSAPVFARWTGYVAYRLPQVAGRVAATDAFQPAAFAALAGRITDLAERVSAAVAPAPCHRDLYLDNLLATPDAGLAALVDFDGAEAWDPAVDLVKLRWQVFPRYPGARAAFEAAYHPADVPPRWPERVELVELLELVNHVANARAVGDRGFEDLGRDRLTQVCRASAALETVDLARPVR
ncbi:aminoglycoside phosphotransferase family protein [Jiangella ureilytica]|uniref:aminoglycoside phosphotransferase family protein n=1 Tax=Jiangella ureilytica TaxID=2530374 RepID=UPI0013A5D49B|nr:aminoglycoside phosphotransferase family protein [Jiangella ureilytica]